MCHRLLLLREFHARYPGANRAQPELLIETAVPVRGNVMILTRLIASSSRPSLGLTTKAAWQRTFRTLSSTTTTTMGVLNGQPNGATSKQNGVRSNLVPIASRLEEGRALAQDVWSIFKYVSSHRACSYARPLTDPTTRSTTVLPIYLRIVSTSARDT